MQLLWLSFKWFSRVTKSSVLLIWLCDDVKCRRTFLWNAMWFSFCPHLGASLSLWVSFSITSHHLSLQYDVTPAIYWCIFLQSLACSAKLPKNFTHILMLENWFTGQTSDCRWDLVCLSNTMVNVYLDFKALGGEHCSNTTVEFKTWLAW